MAHTTTRALGVFVAVVVAFSTLGALASLVTNGLLTGQYGLAAIVAVLVVVGAVGAVALAGRRSSRWTENPDHYW
jgi:hypothetical protein